ncbi:MAG TPA: serine protease [Pyrinomonadaceae bacterium]|nr:serine protease [Pyrinomonadaceae bacterium]
MRLRSAFVALLLLFASQIAFAQDEASKRVAPAVATILVRDGAGRFEAVGSGVFVRNDGVLMTAYNLVQGAREIQVRLANGEIYDHAELVASDERRNVAVLRIYATATPFTLVAMTDESDIGTETHAVYSAGGRTMDEAVGALSSISLADEIPGAGTGFRVLKFKSPVTVEAVGGVLIDAYGRAIGLIAPQTQAETRNYAVPLYNVVGLVRTVPAAQTASSAVVLAAGPRELNRAVPVFQQSTTPLAPMPQGAVPERPTSPLMPAGPGSTVVREADPAKLLASSKTLYITSCSNIFKPVQLLNELRKRQEFTNWNLSFVGEREVADLILEIEHVPLTWEFNFSIRHQRTGVVIATGKIYAWGGGDGAELMASRVVEKLTKVRARP